MTHSGVAQTTTPRLLDLDALVPGTDVTWEEIIELGQYAFNAAAAAESLGHTSVTGLTDYVAWPDSRMGDVMRGIIWATLFSKGDDTSAKHKERLTEILWDSGWMHRVAEAATT